LSVLRSPYVELKNSVCSAAENCISSPCQALPALVLLYQSHRNRNASPFRLMLFTPKPPQHRGWHTVRQLTWQLPPFVAALPSQKKPRSIFTNYLTTFLVGARIINWWRGVALSTDLISARRPALCISLDFHVGSIPATSWTSGCS
jgi:hypothetical protein